MNPEGGWLMEKSLREELEKLHTHLLEAIKIKQPHFILTPDQMEDLSAFFDAFLYD